MIEMCFGVPVFVVDCNDADLKTSLDAETQTVCDEYKKSTLNNPWGGNILTTFKYNQSNHIIQNHCPILKNHILASVNTFLNQLEVNPKYSYLNMYDSWINYSEKGMYQEYHCHPYSDISGAYYVQTHENSGDIQFMAPSSAYNHSELCLRSKFLTSNIKYKAVTNRLVLFPSWLQHGTLPNISEKERISISFNIKLVP